VEKDYRLFMQTLVRSFHSTALADPHATKQKTQGVVCLEILLHFGVKPPSRHVGKAELLEFTGNLLLEKRRMGLIPPAGELLDNDTQRPPKMQKKNKPRSTNKPSLDQKKMFYKSWAWRTLRAKILKRFGARCMCCGATPDHFDMDGSPVKICVDHIKPVSLHWKLRLDPENLQVLCDECNQGKGAWDQTDYRKGRNDHEDTEHA
jgi:5-methylcytosine-specific restriction endonuclease McrA